MSARGTIANLEELPLRTAAAAPAGAAARSPFFANAFANFAPSSAAITLF